MTKKKKKKSSRILLISALIDMICIYIYDIRRTYFYPKKMVLLCSCNWMSFHILTLANRHYRVTEMFKI